MTKDEILGKRPVMCDNKGVTVYVSFSNAMDAMDEYAKQQAIAFFKFCLRAQPISSHTSHPDTINS
jgi:hypothetical protein